MNNIKQRGGKVVFIRFPATDEHWELDEKYFPRDKYWDTYAISSEANLIHFRDIKEMNNIKCPDYSHLDYRDTRYFTQLLVSELLKRKIFTE